jgi:hypothetical protein
MSFAEKTSDRPDLAVIDRAIELVRSGQERWTCWALVMAENPRGCSPRNKYTAQFRLHMTSDRGLPDWWTEGENTPENRALRIAALKSFRQACIDAAIQAPGAGHGDA